MKVRQIKEIKVELSLTQDEAYYLKCLIQNPLLVDDANNEDHKQKEIRSRFWNALPSFEELEDR